MRQLSIAAIAATSTIAFAQIALAADLPIKAMVHPVAPTVYNWTGCYIGLNAGGVWGHSDVTTNLIGANANGPGIAAAGSPSFDPSGFTGGGQVGCNWQTGNFVLGLEADFGYFGLKSDQTATTPFTFGGGTFTTSNSVKTDWLFTARPRLGYAWDNFLLYVTGGLAVTQIKYATTFTDTFADFETASLSTTRAGWTVGGGVEYGFSRNWTAKVEYLYSDFGTVSTSGTCCSGTVTFTHDVKLTTNVLRAGINYRF
jgi:outer membrane immunogenic protein